MKRTLIAHLLLAALFATQGFSQMGDMPGNAPAQSSGGSGGSGNSNASSSNKDKGQSSFLGKDMPFFNPGNEIITWDGKNWNVNNNRIFEARFEKYLNAPQETDKDDVAYNAILTKIMQLLAPGRADAKNQDESFKLLPQASEFKRDANLCDAIGNQVYSAWSARRAAERLLVANQSLEAEKKKLEWNSQVVAQSGRLDANSGGSTNNSAEVAKSNEMKRQLEIQPIATRLIEVSTLMKANQMKKEVSELQTKIEFQSLIVQLFLQRRFQHVVIATRFYRAVFNDGDSQLRIGEDAKNLFSKTTGMPPTVGIVDTAANEIMRDVDEGVTAFNFLLERDELESASKRLAETFLIGEYLPAVRTLSRDKKRQALEFVKKGNQLVSALEVKDYALAESLVKDLQTSAKDFDNSKPMAAIETARTIAGMHIAKAKNAAVSGDKDTLETELKAATEIWPRNPDLKEVSSIIFSQADVQGRALVDFDQLLGQRNYRQIYDDRVRFIAATVTNPEKQQQLQKVLENMAIIESAIIRAQEIEKRGDYPGAWESSERAFRQFPEDNKLNQVRADLTTKAADFVRALRNAETSEKKNDLGSSLAWYLKAKQIYPPSEFADDGINHLVKKLYPDAK